MGTAPKYAVFKLQRCVRVCKSRQAYSISNSLITIERRPALGFIHPIQWGTAIFPHLSFHLQTRSGVRPPITLHLPMNTGGVLPQDKARFSQNSTKPNVEAKCISATFLACSDNSVFILAHLGSPDLNYALNQWDTETFALLGCYAK
jgi:hypothetical protein